MVRGRGECESNLIAVGGSKGRKKELRIQEVEEACFKLGGRLKDGFHPRLDKNRGMIFVLA